MPSIWDTYLAPGDIRAQRRAEDSRLRHHRPPTAAPPPPPTVVRADAATRQRRQDGLLYGGLVFTALSALITRRTLIRKRLPPPSTFSPSNTPPPPVNGGLEAAEALGLATLNVFSIGMLALGAFMKVFDVGEIEDLRDQIRRSAGYDVYAGDSAADREVEEWVAGILASKEGEGGAGGMLRGVAEKVRDMQDKDRAALGRMEGRVVEEVKAKVEETKRAVNDRNSSGWFGGLFASQPAYDPTTSSNPYINGSKELRAGAALCARCGQLGHLATQCAYAPLTPEEQNYLSKMIADRTSG
ncbi:hypothetical protein EJ03DRAFT_53708 [Teratosphaeria nubilosa]|uniref:Altered inheritance of mitochondria protein 11 n=1 Tax=Teratosphaeria nubilosa TaxID=161662 RepID=A0A6G1KT59_9PEZI|nr:hypothetical protein EJ03DRAFT_53708 [Teratosphaeria nubilosa]